jgi:hypothetical protein
VYNALKTASQTANFSVYRSSELPQRWHYGQSPRTPPLLAVANIGYAFQDLIEWNQEWFEHKFNKTCKNTQTVPAGGKEREGGTNYWGPANQNGHQGRTVLRMFCLSWLFYRLSAVQLIPFRQSASHSAEPLGSHIPRDTSGNQTPL